ncbi:amino acid ABC transporter substrate-binding protein [Aquabacter spiritensis]|uniref:General L-amino acid transport system substrate-binding protein n=1 Tax=Aquabacter spiritensis TaxID=933073 RepID=A0A4R3M3K6_9HYPH|nr:amino acid ABC transporter substrate-binding protein [Aquabacter spiritensis]TCT07780.1 general L-amino acid transport system substrate-binding protein [Aquabacter spiritensis]
MKTLLTLLAGATLALSAHGAGAQTLKAVKDRGELNCGVSRGLPGFSQPDAKGTWTGFDVDFCRAVAAAVLNDPAKVKFVPLSADDRFPALQNSAIDVLSRNSTWTLEREAKLNLLFGPITYYDGQGFLVPNSRKVLSALELDGSKVCVQSGTTAVGYTEDFFKTNTMKLELVTVPTSEEMVKAYEDGRCDTLTTDVSQLFALRLVMKKPADHIVLPDVISKEPLGPVVRQGDDQWFNIVKWTHYAMLNAEELGVTQANIEAALKSQKPDVKRLVGNEGNYGEQLGLTKDYAVRIVKAVGNYGEVYERNVGTGSKLAIPRGINQLWNLGGIQYAPPAR